MEPVMLVEDRNGVRIVQGSEIYEDVFRVAVLNTTHKMLMELQSDSIMHQLNNTSPLKLGEPTTVYTFDALYRMLNVQEVSLEGQFIKTYTYRDHGTKIALQELWDAYCVFCTMHGEKPKEKKSFGKYLTNTHGLQRKQTTYNKQNLTCVFGINIIGNA